MHEERLEQADTAIVFACALERTRDGGVVAIPQDGCAIWLGGYELVGFFDGVGVSSGIARHDDVGSVWRRKREASATTWESSPFPGA